MKLNVKRAYDKVEKEDGFRVLIDRLWPRGVSKDKAKIDLWAKDVAPSSELRSWLHADPENHFKEFSRKYAQELAAGDGLKNLKNTLKDKKTVTFITAAKDIEHSHVPVLLKNM